MANTRINFKTILEKYKNVNKGNVRLTQSTLILTKPISATTTQYSFDVLESQTQTLENSEIRLNLNDEFIVTSLGFYIQCSVLDSLGANTGAKYLLPYAPFEQDSANAAKIANYWNGSFQIAVNNIVYLDKYDTRKSMFIPRTQFADFLLATGQPSTQPSVDLSKDGMYNSEPLLTLSGAKKNDLKLNLSAAIQPATFRVKDNQGTQYTLSADRVLMIARGLNAQNGASFQS